MEVYAARGERKTEKAGSFDPVSKIILILIELNIDGRRSLRYD